MTATNEKQFDVQEDDFPELQRQGWAEIADAIYSDDDDLLARLDALAIGESLSDRDSTESPIWTFTRVA